jgi:DNA-directed DNA polymerase III PolC
LVIKLISEFTPAGQGRVIFSGKEPENLIKVFKEVDWQCFLNMPISFSRKTKVHILELAKKLSLKLIYAPTILFRNNSDRLTARLLKAIQNNALLNDTKIPDGYDLIQIQNSSCLDCDEALKNNQTFCNTDCWIPRQNQLIMPSFTSSRQKSAKLLYDLGLSGLKQKYIKISDKTMRRFDYELSVIKQMGFCDYFLTVNEINLEAKRLGTRVLGRGSAANSLVSYALNLTQVDPIRHNLYFERFLNPHRNSPPDIDLDFSWRIRDQIYEFLKRRWKETNVGLVSAHVCLTTRKAIRETGKTLGIKSEDLNFLSAITGRTNLKDFLNNPNKHARFKGHSAKLQKLLPVLHMARNIEKLPTHFSIHAGGVVITPVNLNNFTISRPCSKIIALTDFDMEACKAFGLVKIDLLSQRALGVYADAAKEVQIPDSIKQLENDNRVIHYLENGKTLGVFYIESPGMRGLLKKLNCKSFADLTAASSIIRPGVAESGMMQEYIKRHKIKQNWKPPHPLLKDALKETYGIMVYQEDVMKVAHLMAGMSMAESDSLRRAMSGSGRSSRQMNETAHLFINKAITRGIPEKIVKEVWRQIKSFCGYAFCKAHSASYAVLSLQLLWLKVNYPILFYKSVLNNHGGFYGAQVYISAAIRSGIEFLPPDVRYSEKEFIITDGKLLTGLEWVKDLKNETVKRILSQRKIAPFKDISNFISRIYPDEGEFKRLVDSGSLECFGSSEFCNWVRTMKPGENLFGVTPQEFPEKLTRPINRLEKIKKELQSLGIALSGHPIELYDTSFRTCKSDKISSFAGKKIKIAGLLVAAKSVETANNKNMKFLTLEDEKGLIEVSFFPEAWAKNSINLKDAGILKVEGKVIAEEGLYSINGSKLSML